MGWYEQNQSELEDTEEAIVEVERCLARLKVWQDIQEASKTKGDYISQSQERAAARRASLDASKALAKFRRRR